MLNKQKLKVGLVSVSDRASQGVYADQGIPALQSWLEKALIDEFEIEVRLIPDEQQLIEQTLVDLVDNQYCHLVLTTGGTGPSKRDVTPDATLAIADREMPGFGEQMRQVSLQFVPTAILSRQVGVIRGRRKRRKRQNNSKRHFLRCALLLAITQRDLYRHPLKRVRKFPPKISKKINPPNEQNHDEITTLFNRFAGFDDCASKRCKRT